MFTGYTVYDIQFSDSEGVTAGSFIYMRGSNTGQRVRIVIRALPYFTHPIPYFTRVTEVN